jgi:hypothetical protein
MCIMSIIVSIIVINVTYNASTWSSNATLVCMYSVYVLVCIKCIVCMYKYVLNV